MVPNVTEIFPNLPAYLQEELSPNKNMIKIIMMVGAETEDGPYFGLVDTHNLQNTVSLLRDFKMPMGQVFNGLADVQGRIRSDLGAVPIFNVREEFGGRDFLANQDEADVVVFCNIPFHSVSYGDIHVDPSYGNAAGHLRMQRSFSRTSSGDDTIEDWRAAIARSDPKFIFLYGGPDCHQIVDFKTDKHVSISCGNGCEVLVRKDVLDDLTMKIHYLKERSPLLRVSTSLSEEPEINHFKL